jgi:integrase
MKTAAAKQHPHQGGRSIPSPLVLRRKYPFLQPRAEVIMQNGSVVRRIRKMHSDIWQFRWREETADGKKIYLRRQIGTIDQIPDLESARKAASLLVSDLNARMARSNSVSMTIAQLCSHFEQSELCLTNTWRSYSTKNIYKVYLKRWIIPKWSERLLSDIRTIEVESWLRSLPIARSTCAKIRNVMSVLFNHACRYEFFDGNPIRLVRQSAKRRSPPAILTAAEIRTLLEGLKLREKTLVIIAASTGIRQSELFALKWSDINLSGGTMNVARSIVHGFVGPCKTESSQKPVPIHPRVCEALVKWKEQSIYRQPEDWVFASRHSHGKQPFWGQAILHKYLRPAARELGIETQLDGIHSGTPTQPS